MSKPLTIENLPDNCLLRVFENIPKTNSLCPLFRVCTRWNALAKRMKRRTTRELVIDRRAVVQFPSVVEYAKWVGQRLVVMTYVSNKEVPFTHKVIHVGQRRLNGTFLWKNSRRIQLRFKNEGLDPLSEHVFEIGESLYTLKAIEDTGVTWKPVRLTSNSDPVRAKIEAAAFKQLFHDMGGDSRRLKIIPYRFFLFEEFDALHI